MQNRLPHPWLLTLVIVFATSACSATSQISSTEAERIRETERQRLRSLVKVDIPTAERLHADDFQLINPAGSPLTKREYLDSLRSRQLDYVAWEAGEIAVRLYGRAAVIRYRDTKFEVAREGKLIHRGPMFHTNVYEKRGDQWQIVWSQASGVITPP